MTVGDLILALSAFDRGMEVTHAVGLDPLANVAINVVEQGRALDQDDELTHDTLGRRKRPRTRKVVVLR